MAASVKSTELLISDELLATLKSDIDSRRIEHGLNRLASTAPIIDSFNPLSKNAAAFIYTLAQWCDIGYGDVEVVKRLLGTYDKKLRSKLTISDYVYVRMVEGMLAMTQEMLDIAVEHFDIALKLADETNAWDVLAIANYWTARCQRKKGQYESALGHVRRAREIQRMHGHVQNEVPARVLESSILFQAGNSKDAIANLRDAEAILMQTDDYVTLGNIESAYGRILQRELRYGQAIKHYSRAIEHFQKRDSKCVNVARAIVDMSFARIQMARHFRRNIEGYAGQRPQNGQQGPAHAVLVKELSNLYQIILSDLDRAAQIFNRRPNARGIARVHLTRAYLRLEMGELDLAAEQALAAYSSAESRLDFILMASARNLQCKVENARVEEEVEGWADHAVASHDYARESIELANYTQDRRVLASVYTWYGLTLSNAFFNSWDRAREAMDQAATYLEPGVRDYLWEDFQILKKRLSESATLEPKLMQWAQGQVGNKSFRELEQDFADLVIPRVWDQEKKKVSRAASRLSISPRKVRRVLIRLGLLEGEAHSTDDRTNQMAHVGDHHAVVRAEEKMSSRTPAKAVRTKARGRKRSA